MGQRFCVTRLAANQGGLCALLAAVLLTVAAAPCGPGDSPTIEDGDVPRTESDEHVIVRNSGNTVAQHAGWILIDSADGKPEFVFPGYLLGPGVSVRVYTNEVHLEHGVFSFGSRTAIWNNTDPDTTALLDPGRREVSSATYPPGG